VVAGLPCILGENGLKRRPNEAVEKSGRVSNQRVSGLYRGRSAVQGGSHPHPNPLCVSQYIGNRLSQDMGYTYRGRVPTRLAASGGTQSAVEKGNTRVGEAEFVQAGE
jgi:hypothetical protein